VGKGLLRKWANNLLSLRVFNVQNNAAFLATALCEISAAIYPGYG
jgi:hypothetical protein